MTSITRTVSDAPTFGQLIFQTLPQIGGAGRPTTLGRRRDITVTKPEHEIEAVATGRGVVGVLRASPAQFTKKIERASVACSRIDVGNVPCVTTRRGTGGCG